MVITQNYFGLCLRFDHADDEIIQLPFYANSTWDASGRCVDYVALNDFCVSVKRLETHVGLALSLA